MVTRHPGATYVLPTENEWYKAAYYDPASSSYFDYPAGSDAPTVCSVPSATPNRANCNSAIPTGEIFNGQPAIVGSYPASASPYGTFDQGGNVKEWIEDSRGNVRGGDYYNEPYRLAAFQRGSLGINDKEPTVGFRLAMIPEPSTGLLVIAGLLGLGMRRMISA
jgi:formylglycine-generating enzyme required for sulfatase activity